MTIVSYFVPQGHITFNNNKPKIQETTWKRSLHIDFDSFCGQLYQDTNTQQKPNKFDKN